MTTLDMKHGRFFSEDDHRNLTGQVHGDEARFWLGAGGKAGKISLGNGVGGTSVNIDGAEGDYHAGAQGKMGNFKAYDEGGTLNGNLKGSGEIFLKDRGNTTLTLKGPEAGIWAGGSGKHGKLIVKNGNDVDTIQAQGETGDILLGNSGTRGNVKIFHENGTQGAGINGAGELSLKENGQLRIQFNAVNAEAQIGGSGKPGQMVIKDPSDNVTLKLDGASGSLTILNKDGETARIDQNGFVAVRPAGVVPDYVFEKNHQLRPLKALAEFIERHQHLPEVPSAAEVEREGLNLADFSLKLLRKIEELTLYVLALEKRVGALESEVSREMS